MTQLIKKIEYFCEYDIINDEWRLNMIFGNGYDTSLWCILAGNKKNRYKILDFIKSIPPELFNKVHEAILKLQQYHQQEHSLEDDFDMYDTVKVGQDILYSFQLCSYDELTLVKSVLNGNGYDTVFELTLCDITSLEDFDNFDDEYLGTVDSTIKRTGYVTECDEREYELIKTPFGFLVTYSRDDAIIIKSFGKFINLNKMPIDLNIDDLNQFSKCKKLGKLN